MKKLQESGENYLEKLYILKKRQAAVRSIDLAKALSLSKPSVSRAVHILEDGGYLRIENNGNLELTPAGLEIAGTLYERHVFLSNYLSSLGVDPLIATEDACRIEHVISEESFRKMKEHIRFCIQDCPRNVEDRLLNLSSFTEA